MWKTWFGRQTPEKRAEIIKRIEMDELEKTKHELELLRAAYKKSAKQHIEDKFHLELEIDRLKDEIEQLRKTTDDYDSAIYDR